jgi:hypothetical protein
MPKKLCTIALLVLALSPFTAPFQTCRFADVMSGTDTDAALILTPPAAAQPCLSDDADLLVPPLTIAAGRLRLSPVSALVTSNVIAPPRVIVLAPPVTPSPTISGFPFPPTALRI